MNKCKKILYAILSIVMIFTCLPVTVFATECNGEEYHNCVIKDHKAVCTVCGKEKVYNSYNVDNLDKQYTLSGDEISFYDSNYQKNKSRYNCIKIKINKRNTPVYFYNKTERFFDSANYSPVKLRILDDNVIPQDKIDYYFLLKTNSDYDMLKSLRNVYGDDNTFNQYIYDNSEKIKFNDISIFNDYKPIYLDKGTYYLIIGDNFDMTSEIAISNKPIFKCKSNLSFDNPDDYQKMFNGICEVLPDKVSSEQYKEAFKDDTPVDLTTLTFEECVYWYNEYYKEKGRDFVTDYPLVKSISGILLNCTDDKFPIEAFYKFLLNHNPSEPQYCDAELTTELPSLSGKKYQHNFTYTYTPNYDDTHYKYGTCKNEGCYSSLTEKDLYRLSEDDLANLKLDYYGYSKNDNEKMV